MQYYVFHAFTFRVDGTSFPQAYGKTERAHFTSNICCTSGGNASFTFPQKCPGRCELGPKPHNTHMGERIYDLLTIP